MTQGTAWPALEVRSLCKKFGSTTALHNVSLQARRGEVHALIGEHGSGKSTLAKTLSGAVQCDSGLVLVNNQTLRPLSPSHSWRSGLAVVPQDGAVIPNLSAAENVFVGHEIRRGPWVLWRRTEEAAALVLESVGADFDPRQVAGRLTRAQQQLLVIARAVARNGQVLVLDEPTSSLDANDTDRLLNVICGLRNKGLAIVYISQRLKEIFSLADEVTVLRHGEVSGTLRGEAIATQAVIELMSESKAKVRPAIVQAPEFIEVNEVRPDVRHTSFRLNLVPPVAAPVQAPALRSASVAALEAVDLSDGKNLRSLQLRLEPGEIVGLTGVVGCGRSRLCRLLCGAQLPLAGQLFVGGVRHRFRSPADALQAGVAYVADTGPTGAEFTRLNALDNLTVGLMSWAHRYGVLCEHTQLEREAQDILRRLDVELNDPDWARARLPQAAREILGLARALMSRPKVLLLDEPLKYTSRTTGRKLVEMVRELAKTGVAVLWVASEGNEVVRLADRVIVMHEGEINGDLQARPNRPITEGLVLSYATGIRSDDRERFGAH